MSVAFSIIVLCVAVVFFLLGFDTEPERLAAELDGQGLEKTPDRFHKPGKLTRRDGLLMLLLTLVYAIVAFAALGDREGVESWHRFSRGGDAAEITLSEEGEIARIQYYCGPTVGNYTLEWSADGETWEGGIPLEQNYVAVLKWHEYIPEEPLQDVKKLRFTADRADLTLGEVALRDESGRKLHITGGELTDEQGLVPTEESYLNSSYFDEIYHARTAWEHIADRKPYEITHPPLGKLIIGLGIRLFGMTPFGWRFSGVLFGVLMLPLLYCLLKWMLNSTVVAFCTASVFALDFMHFTQTRIATIDTYCVFFTLLMYLFFYRYYVQPLDTPLKKTLPPLMLSGLSFALGAVSKWTCIFGGAGLAILWLVRQIERLLYARHHGIPNQLRDYLLPTVGWSCVFFLGFPVVCYLLAYIPYGTAAGVKLLSGDYLKVILDNIKYMYNYHSGLDATHPYSSPWWKWVLDIRPILYYLHYSADGVTKSAFGACGNPLFWWGGLGAMILMIVKGVRGDRMAWFILAGYLSSLLPWVTVERCAFIYHYFPCTVFLALAVGRVCRDQAERSRGKGLQLAPFMAIGCAVLFVVFYPALSGRAYPVEYGKLLLRWFGGSWPF